MRLQGQAGPGTEAKHRNTSSIASWFGLKKSKLPALNRRTETTKGKEGAGAPGSGRKSRWKPGSWAEESQHLQADG